MFLKKKRNKKVNHRLLPPEDQLRRRKDHRSHQKDHQKNHQKWMPNQSESALNLKISHKLNLHQSLQKNHQINKSVNWILKIMSRKLHVKVKLLLSTEHKSLIRKGRPLRMMHRETLQLLLLNNPRSMKTRLRVKMQSRCRMIFRKTRKRRGKRRKKMLLLILAHLSRR